MRLVFADVETTGLRPDMGAEVWEIALIVRSDVIVKHQAGPDTPGTEDTEHAWQLRPDLRLADPHALKVGGYYQRCQVARGLIGTARDLMRPNSDAMTATVVADLVAEHLDGALIVGTNPWFDADHLDAFLRGHGQCLAADYHMRDIGSLVTGFIAGKRRVIKVAEVNAAIAGCPAAGGWEAQAPDWPATAKITDMATAIGLDPAEYAAHTALGDARLARDIWDVVMCP